MLPDGRLDPDGLALVDSDAIEVGWMVNNDVQVDVVVMLWLLV